MRKTKYGSAVASIIESSLACLTIQRIAVAAVEDGWTNAEMRHLLTCYECRRTVWGVQEGLEHPGWAAMATYIARRADIKQTESVEAHLIDLGCRRCRATFLDVASMLDEGSRARSASSAAGHADPTKRSTAAKTRKGPEWTNLWHSAMRRVHAALAPVRWLSVRVQGRISPYTVISATTALVLIASGLIATERYLLGGVLLVISLPLEMLDGELTRMAVDSRRAVFVDFMADRVGELALFMGLAWPYTTSSPRTAFLMLTVMGISIFSSYTRAQGAALGFNLYAIQLGRGLRLILVVLAAFLTPLRVSLVIVVGAISILTIVLRARGPLHDGGQLDAATELRVDRWGDEFPARLVPVGEVNEDKTRIGRRRTRGEDATR